MFEKLNQSATRKPQSAIRFGVIGCGWVARDYAIPAIIESANARLVALCDTNLANCEAIAPENAEILRTDDLDEFLASEYLDAVYIATPNDSHRFLTEKCAARGKHVLCEKPMATNYADALRMTEACENFGVQYATAFDQRFQARHLKLKELIENDVFGTITAVKIQYACWLPADWSADNWRIDGKRAGGGAFIDLAPHGIDLSQFLLNEPLVEFACFLQTRVQDYAVDDGAAAIGKFAGGALFSQNVAYNCPDEFPRRTLEIIGTKAMATATNTMGQTAGGNLYLTAATGARNEVSISEADDISPFRRQIEIFSDCLLNEKPFPFTPGQDLATMRIVCGATEDRRWKMENER